MPWIDRHPSDERLLLAIDRELPPWRQLAVDAHLSVCVQCRRKADDLGLSAATLTRVVHSMPSAEPPTIGRERARLASGLRASRSSRHSSWIGIGGGVPRFQAVLAVAVAVLVAGLTVRVVRDRVIAGPTSAAVGDRGALPIASLTPGATANVTADTLCAGGAPAIRPIPQPMRQRVLRDYRMEHVPEGEYELDYLITPELGGATDPANLWPERYGDHTWNARVKDQLETLLPALVCRGAVDLTVAQRDIAANWITAYRKYFKSEVPLRTIAMRRDSDEDERETRLRPSHAGPALRLISFYATE